VGKAILIAFAISTACALAQPVTVPFVGCNSQGQIQMFEAPQGEPKVVPLRIGAAQKLAYYKSQFGRGVLAPRGWFCVGANGSSSAELWVTPEVIDPGQTGFSGPVVELSGIDGMGSGGYEVALIIARVFPAHRSFLRGFLADGLELPIGPYPDDKLKYKSRDIVEYLTPAQSEGLGTQRGLRRNASPIVGVAILTPEPTGVDLLSVRLPPDLAHLTPIIVRQVESDVAKNDWEPR